MGCGGSKPTGAEASATNEAKADDAVAVEEVQAEVDADAEPDIPEATQIFDPFKGDKNTKAAHKARLHAILQTAAGSDKELDKEELIKLFGNGGFKKMLMQAEAFAHFDENYDGEADIQTILDELDSNLDGKIDLEEAFQAICEQIWMYGSGLEGGSWGKDVNVESEASVMPTAN